MSIEVQREALRSDDAETRRRAVVALRELGSHDVGGLLLSALGDDDWRVRKEAASALVSLAESLKLVNRLVDAICQGDNVGLRNAALDVLEALGPKAAPALVEALPHVPEHARKFVVEALGESGGARVIEELSKAAASSDPNVAGEALEALARIGGPQAEVVLHGRLGSTDPFLRMAALDGLNRLDARVDWSDLVPLLGDRLLRRVVLKAAGRSGSLNAVQPLVTAFADPAQQTMEVALLAIERLIGESEAARADGIAAFASLETSVRPRIRELLDREGSFELRRAAGRVLAAARDVDSLPGIVRLCADDAPTEGLLDAMRAWGAAACQPLLEIAGSRRGPSERAVALELAADLALLDDSLGRPIRDQLRRTLRSAIGDVNGNVAAAAARCFGPWADDADARTLVDAVHHRDSSVARAAAGSLIALAERAPADVEAAIAQVSLATVAGALIAPLVAALGGSTAFDRLHSALTAEEPAARRAAIAGLAQIGGERPAELIALALVDEDPEVRSAAAQGLGRLREAVASERGVEALLAALESDQSIVRAAAARALGNMGIVRAIDALTRLVLESDVSVALAAVDGIKRLKPKDTTVRLGRALSHPEGEVVKAALEVLVSADPAIAADAIATALSHWAWDVRRAAAELAIRYQVKGALAALVARQETEEDVLVQEILGRAVTELSGGK